MIGRRNEDAKMIYKYSGVIEKSYVHLKVPPDDVPLGYTTKITECRWEN